MKLALLAAGAVVALAPVSVSAVTIVQIGADFNTPVGGSNVTYQNNDGIAGNEVFHWGTAATNAGNNSFTFNSTTTPLTVATDTQFSLGTFSYSNQATYGTALTSLNLTLATTIGSTTSNFLFQLGVTETPNVTPCPFASVTPCSDQVTVTPLNNTGTFVSGGQTYTLFIDGFQDSSGNFSTTFLGDEGVTTTATVIGRFSTAVPEAATWGMMILGFGAMGFAMRRRARVRTSVSFA